MKTQWIQSSLCNMMAYGFTDLQPFFAKDSTRFGQGGVIPDIKWVQNVRSNNLYGRMVTHLGFIHDLQHNTHYHMKGLLNSFHLNGHTLGFHPQT